MNYSQKIKTFEELYNAWSEYYFYTKPNYVFYYTENDRLIVAEMFNERDVNPVLSQEPSIDRHSS